MRPVCFGKVAVATPGTVVKMGQTLLGSNMTLADESMVVTSAVGFCSDMTPFKMDIDPTGTVETVIVKSISGTTFSIARGVDGSAAAAHTAGVALVARFPFTGWKLNSVQGASGKVYWGNRNLNVSSNLGIIREFGAISSGIDDRDDFMANSNTDNPLKLEDYELDAASGNDGLYITLWVR